MVSGFQRLGHPVAGGWHGDDYSGGRDAIAPDAMIYVAEGLTGGEGWRWFEYEKRPGSTALADGKLRGYAVRGGMPLLVAAKDERMAAELRWRGVALGLEVWAPPISELRVSARQNVAGADTVWQNAADDSFTAAWQDNIFSGAQHLAGLPAVEDVRPHQFPGAGCFGFADEDLGAAGTDVDLDLFHAPYQWCSEGCRVRSGCGGPAVTRVAD